MTSATEQATANRERDQDERSLHRRMEWFTKKWTAHLDGPRARSEFHAALLLLIQAIHRDANRETHRLLVAALAASPPAPIIITKPHERTTHD